MAKVKRSNSLLHFLGKFYVHLWIWENCQCWDIFLMKAKDLLCRNYYNKKQMEFALKEDTQCHSVALHGPCLWRSGEVVLPIYRNLYLVFKINEMSSRGLYQCPQAHCWDSVLCTPQRVISLLGRAYEFHHVPSGAGLGILFMCSSH